MADVRPGDGDARKLKVYWLRGEGAAKLRWGTPGDFDRCVTHLSKYMRPGQAKGYCANLHHDATGMWPGDKQNRRVYKVKGDGAKG